MCEQCGDNVAKPTMEALRERACSLVIALMCEQCGDNVAKPTMEAV